MRNNITVLEDRNLVPESDYFGTVGENIATELVLSFPEMLSGEKTDELSVELDFCNEWGSFVYKISKDENGQYRFRLPAEVTNSQNTDFAIKAYKDKALVWKSVTRAFEFNQAIDSSEKNVITEAKAEQQEADRVELAGSLGQATQADESGNTWPELNQAIKDLNLKSDEDIDNLAYWDTIKDRIESSANCMNPIWSEAGFNPKPTKLPYFYTPNIKWSAEKIVIDSHIIECGFDCSLGTFSYRDNHVFGNLPNLQKIKLTGRPIISDIGFQNFFANDENLVTIDMDNLMTPHAVTAGKYYYRSAFSRCYRLETIVQPLDFTGSRIEGNVFEYCQELRDIKIVPNTIGLPMGSSSLDFRWTPYLTTDSLIQILNGCRMVGEMIGEGEDKIQNYTVTFNMIFEKDVTELPDTYKVHYDEELGLFRYATESEIAKGVGADGYFFIFDAMGNVSPKNHCKGVEVRFAV